ncbi:hypothetical protein JNK13_07490 [bacterium]|nr:hypothetical protein [bacterium]
MRLFPKDCSILAIFLVFTGCFRMGLPEHFALNAPPASHQQILNSSAATTLIVIPEAKSGSLGNQYVFGLVPLTRVYFEQGIERYLHEISVQTVERLRGPSVEVYQQDIPALAKLYRPEQVLKLELLRPTVNAYDLLFTRLVSLSGTLRCSVLNYKGNVLYSATYELGLKRLKSTGNALVLSSLLKSELQRLLVKFLEESISFKSQSQLQTTSTRGVLLVNQPKLEARLDAELLQAFAQSYGFNNMGPLPQEALVRIAEQGALRAAREVGLQVGRADIMPSMHTQSGDQSLPANFMTAVTKIEQLELVGTELQLKLQLELIDLSGGINQQNQVGKWDCVLREQQDSSKDGALVVALENASNKAWRSALLGPQNLESADKDLCKIVK